MISRLAASALFLSAMGCTTTPTIDDAPPPEEGIGDCNAEPTQSLVGQPATAELGAQALELSGAKTLRWIQPGQPVTMDFRSDRLNIKLDDENRVESTNCG